LVALDYSAGMLALADPRCLASGPTPPPCRCTTGARTSRCYSFVLSSFRTRAAIAEAARVLRSGGWLLAATWGSQLGTTPTSSW
jgi:ubiquinone/menaquinone biosynthesis C-methylase UbiE